MGVVDLIAEFEVNNKIVVVESHSELVPVREVPPAVAVVLLDGARQELIAGYVFQMCCQSFDHLL